METLEAVDQGALHPFRHLADVALLRPILIGLHFLGDPYVLLVLLFLAVVGLMMANDRKAAILLAVTVFAALGLALGLKRVVNRERPGLAWSHKFLVEPESKSFPSAHALGSTALYGGLGLMLMRRTGKSWPMIFGGVLAFLAGFDRMLIGHNYLSDVLAGWAAGALLVMIAGDVDRRMRAKPQVEASS